MLHTSSIFNVKIYRNDFDEIFACKANMTFAKFSWVFEAIKLL